MPTITKPKPYPAKICPITLTPRDKTEITVILGVDVSVAENVEHLLTAINTILLSVKDGPTIEAKLAELDNLYKLANGLFDGLYAQRATGHLLHHLRGLNLDILRNELVFLIGGIENLREVLEERRTIIKNKNNEYRLVKSKMDKLLIFNFNKLYNQSPEYLQCIKESQELFLSICYKYLPSGPNKKRSSHLDD